MNENSSFDEHFNLYTNAVNNLIESDDEDFPSMKPEENHVGADAINIETAPKEVSVPLSSRQQRRQNRRPNPVSAQGRGRKQARGRPRGRPRRVASFQSSNSFDSSDDEIMTVVEINDDSPVNTPQEHINWADFDDDGDILWDSAKKIDVVGISSPDVSISGIEIEQNLEVDILVKWKLQGSKRFTLKKLDTMKDIFKYYAQAEGVPESQISFMHKGKAISPYDTPEKLKTSVIILEGNLKAVNNGQQPETADPNQIELKVLMKDMKDKLSIFIFRNEPLEVFMEKASAETKLPLSKLSFQFDGDNLDKTETPDSMELEGGECIEVFVRP